jgi:hypothetical protein
MNSILAVRFDRATLALKCDLRDDASTRERLARYGMQAVQYEEGLATARRMRASRYLGMQSLFPSSTPPLVLTSFDGQSAAQSTTVASRRYSTRLLAYPSPHGQGAKVVGEGREIAL